MKPQFSLLKVLWIVAFIAFCCATLVKPSYYWTSIVWTAAMTILAVSVVAAFARRGESRCFWASFAIFGWGYMVLSLAPWFDGHTGELLATRHVLDSLGHRLGYLVPDHSEMPGIWDSFHYAQAQHGLYVPPTPTAVSYVHYQLFLVSGQSLISLALALGGGYLGRFFYITRARSSATPQK